MLSYSRVTGNLGTVSYNVEVRVSFLVEFSPLKEHDPMYCTIIAV